MQNSSKKNSYFELINAKVALRSSIVRTVGWHLFWALVGQGSGSSTKLGMLDSRQLPRRSPLYGCTMSISSSFCHSSLLS